MTNKEQNNKLSIGEAFWAVKKGYPDFNFKASVSLIVAAIEEFQRNNQPCYLTNEQFAHITKESTRSVGRILDTLEQHNIIQRNTSTVKGKPGRQRTIELLPMYQWTIPIVYKSYKGTSQTDQAKGDSMRQTGKPNDDLVGQTDQYLCDSLTRGMRQTGTIKDKGKDKEKDNNIFILYGDAPSPTGMEKEKEATPLDSESSVSNRDFVLDMWDEDWEI